ESAGHSFAEGDRRRGALHVAHGDRVRRAPFQSLLVEEDRVAVGGQVHRKRPVAPGELALARGSRRQAHHADALLVAREEDAALGGDVVQGDTAGCPIDETLAAGEVDRVDLAIQTGARGGEPDFLAARRPRYAFLALPTGGED